jgi:hypothetical protein
MQGLEILDVFNSSLSEAEDVLGGLTSLPTLCDLQMTLRSEAEEEKLGRSLPNLRNLNEVPVLQIAALSSPLSKLLPPPRNEVRFEEHELEAIALTYDGIRSLWRKKAPEVDKVLAYYFNVYVKQVMNELTSALGKTPNPYLRNVQIINAKYDLNSECLYKLTAYNQTVDTKQLDRSQDC